MATAGIERDCEVLDDLPRLLYDKELLLNMDFLAGAVGVTPTSWTKAGSGTATKETGQSFSADQGAGVLDGLKMIRTGAPNVRLDQTTAAAGVVAPDEPVMFLCAVYPEGPGDASVRIDLFTEDSIATGVETFQGGPSLTLTPGQWHFIARWAQPTTPASPTLPGTRWTARFIMGGGQPVNEPVWWAYAHFGMVSEFTKKFAEPFNIKPKYHGRLTPGTDQFQVVENAPPQNEVKFAMDNVVRNLADDLAWQRFASEVAHRNGGFSIWRDSSQWLNTQDHFQDALHADNFTWRSRKGQEYFNIEVEAHLVKLRSRFPEHIAQ